MPESVVPEATLGLAIELLAQAKAEGHPALVAIAEEMLICSCAKRYPEAFQQYGGTDGDVKFDYMERGQLYLFYKLVELGTLTWPMTPTEPPASTIFEPSDFDEPTKLARAEPLGAESDVPMAGGSV